MNSILHIAPYKSQGQWVFDDPSKELVREALILGIDTMLDRITENIPNRDNGVSILFSKEPFPFYTIELIWLREDSGGNWYHSPVLKLDGWLCPALLHYFSEAPKKIYVKILPKAS